MPAKKNPMARKGSNSPDELVNIARKELRQPGLRSTAKELGRKQFIEVVKTEWGAGEVKTKTGRVAGDSMAYQKALGVAAAELYDRMFPKARPAKNGAKVTKVTPAEYRKMFEAAAKKQQKK